ncbi:MAG: endolytic transglycosylase MltG [Deltaproteobacteria bacterium]|nr:endolytic transglycosylase MltG [Deltaproteobacteria bacterium]
MVSQRLKLFLVPVMAAVTVFAFLLMDTPPSKNWHSPEALVPRGSSSAEIARLLSEKGILQHPLVFRLLVTATGTGRKIKFGEYSFEEPPNVFEVWRKLYRGEINRYEVTIPEGSNIYDIAEILGGQELAETVKFIEIASSRAVLRRLGIPGATAEGFLFPDTYQLDKSMTAEDILESMVKLFRRRLPAEWEGRARDMGFSLLEIVTIASIIEKETGVESEKPLVSAVIRNRMARGMPLQMDPTVIYGLKRFGDELTKKDLQTPSPYNSYLNRGLPPGPIANPGISAIRAALFPADAEYLYFVSRNDGSHRFSKTLQEHNRGVASYRRDKSAE